MTAPDDTPRPTPPARTTAPHTSAGQLDRLADEISGRASVTIVYGEPVTTGGVTVIPVAEIGFGFGYGGGSGHTAGAARTGEGGGGGGGVRARPCGFIEIKNGTAAYRPIRSPWLKVVVPVAALLAGAAVPGIVRRLTGRRPG
ncbi:hypothetical protein GCM10010387_51240 [Streptomyces inusitatus]|uniref:Sporulation protein n=1 Tax=Streptomyces inusitatus TaxID=68221 RepID=A0A918QKG4_9ACTN|nr:spore germination protein GerW family protein [Streptomyces inusitatus]GGZ50701.1 hypothetical protein GCM10010387_51240 [Streptomyces inusitatus]